MALLRRAEIQAPDPAQMFNSLKSNRRRYLFCLAMMEYYRTMWYRGQAEMEQMYVDLSTKYLRNRYRDFNAIQRRRLAAVMWFQSATCKDLAASEQMFCRWAQFYATALRLEGDADGNRGQLPQPHSKLPRL